jgi:hypothetical protein
VLGCGEALSFTLCSICKQGTVAVEEQLLVSRNSQLQHHIMIRKVLVKRTHAGSGCTVTGRTVFITCHQTDAPTSQAANFRRTPAYVHEANHSSTALTMQYNRTFLACNGR